MRTPGAGTTMLNEAAHQPHIRTLIPKSYHRLPLDVHDEGKEGTGAGDWGFGFGARDPELGTRESGSGIRDWEPGLAVVYCESGSAEGI